MFDTVLVANRGEIAVRIIRTLRRLGIRAVAVYSDADSDARHVHDANAAVRLGPAPAAESYLHIGRILEAAELTGAQAVHPGYGFLAENAAFARACADTGLVFIGPPPLAIEMMGDKIRAKETVASAGMPILPGSAASDRSDAELAARAAEIGYPVLIKPSAGGGGKGMRLVTAPAQLTDALAAPGREAIAAFGDDTVLVERYLERPRHVELQVLADAYGNVVHLGERECSLQRRHQKIIEEAPSPLLDAASRARMGAAAVSAAQAVGYVGVGTIECLLSDAEPDRVYFLEMNTRLQVEHAVTEMVTGLDLVELQVRVAAGEQLPFSQDDISINGHAIEARVYAEDPSRGFLPTGGSVLALGEPYMPHVRVDSGLSAGTTVSLSYDPMLAKVIAWAPYRSEALLRLDRALASTNILGLSTNIAFLRELLASPDVMQGKLHTGLAEQVASEFGETGPPADALAGAALQWLLDAEPSCALTDPWDIPDGWRLGEDAWAKIWLTCPRIKTAEIRIRGHAGQRAEVSIDGAEPVAARAVYDSDRRGLEITYGGVIRRYLTARADGDRRVLWIGHDGKAWELRADDGPPARARRASSDDGIVRSPMPGAVIAVRIRAGERVTAGQPLLVVEAMKMEHPVVSPTDGLVSEILVRAGQQVDMDETVAVILAEEAA